MLPVPGKAMLKMPGARATASNVPWRLEAGAEAWAGAALEAGAAKGGGGGGGGGDGSIVEGGGVVKGGGGGGCRRRSAQM